MARKKSLRATFLYVVVSVFFFASLYHYLHDAVSTFSSTAIISFSAATKTPFHRRSLATTAVLVHDWQVLVILSPETPPPPNLDGYSCLFHTNEISPARFSGTLPFPDRATFTCLFPVRARRSAPFRQPVLLRTQVKPPAIAAARPPLPLWSNLVYDSLTTDDDVVLFVKGIHTRQGSNRRPSEFRCVFFSDATEGVRTAVTHSKQEVFRCGRPPLTAVSTGKELVKVTLEIVAENRVVPSVAYYTPPRKLAPNGGKALLCATTMVYDVTKFLREWVLYHAKIGVEKFLLYDNGSDDDLSRVVRELVIEGYDVATYTWRWPKTQEAGFSHSAIYALDACTWMMYIDVDEFVYSPTWHNISAPSPSLLHHRIANLSMKLGQISINCREFGPSEQKVHPVLGVIYGYDCRRRLENRHKSIVKLDAVDESLVNVIHHFYLKEGLRTRKLNTTAMVVNHYKYQAWPEFKAKFRRRVSAYVLDWTQKMNPKSNDRTPGLGFAPVEPAGWPQKFCEVRDEVLKDLAIRWFGIESEFGIKMPWER
ncbi:glycosyltransferase family 92 protein RCOM_0530710 [Salvia miltiorrhiza]|uniref:glycosyltransferase family 92 protein RCOM_0530710 n=1 Tax=Salvia miltiorrhiza TaxID=226208 RepID=UPI0025AC08D0|nr:glycosyltransferase family 92 protein RCOM_0530710 [Salvia miltiorrhiza]